jgi:CelD/BcsL family acetyltransferase involved in cellulose biosynthesis
MGSITPAGNEKFRVQTLLNDCGELSPPFAGEQWLSPWLDLYLRPTDQLRVCWLPAQTGGVLLPLMIRPVLRKGIPLRELRFLGTGDSQADEVASEYPDATCDGVTAEQAVAMITACLRDSRGWDLLAVEAGVEDSLIGQAMANCGAYRQRSGQRYCLDIRAGFDGWLERLGASSRAKFRRTLRQVDERGLSLRLDLSHHDVLEQMVQMHQQRWQSRGEPGAFASHRFRAFHQRMLDERRLAAKIAGLFVDGRAVAFWYGFDLGKVRYFYQSGFDPHYADGFSAGEALHLLMIRDAVECGLHHYDFMKGRDDSWKARFGATGEPMFNWRLPGKSLRGFMLRLVLHYSPQWQNAGVR